MRADSRVKSSGVRWTDEQILGITVIDKSLLVSAAAGSGKTAVLAERCVHLVCDAKPCCDIDELLVVTFTEDAAGQMRRRINEALCARHDEDPSPRLAQRLALVEQVQVSTLHAFCAKLLRQHFHLVGLDPDSACLTPRRPACCEQKSPPIYLADYDTKGDDFFRFVDGYGNGNDRTVIQDMLHLHELLTSVADPAAWMDRSRSQIVDAIELPLEQSELGQELARIIERGWWRSASDATRQLKKWAGWALRHTPLFNGRRRGDDTWYQAFRSDGIDALAEVVKDIQWPNLPAVRGNPPGKDLAKSLVDSVRDEAKKGPWRDLLRFSTSQWRDGLIKIRPHVDLFLLWSRVRPEISGEEQALRAVDFADLACSAVRR